MITTLAGNLFYIVTQGLNQIVEHISDILFLMHGIYHNYLRLDLRLDLLLNIDAQSLSNNDLKYHR